MRVDEELHSIFNEQARQSSAFIYGRRLYELMVAYWPTAEDDPAATPAMQEFAAIWKDKPKIVVSRSLGEVDWNARLVRDDIVGEVARLKARPGYDLDVGGPTTAAPLLRAGLVDEVRLFVQPVILGAGRRSSRRSRILSGWSCSTARRWGPGSSTSATERSAGRADGSPPVLAGPGQVVGVSSVVVAESALNRTRPRATAHARRSRSSRPSASGRTCPHASSLRPPWAARSRRNRRR